MKAVKYEPPNPVEPPEPAETMTEAPPQVEATPVVPAPVATVSATAESMDKMLDLEYKKAQLDFVSRMRQPRTAPQQIINRTPAGLRAVTELKTYMSEMTAVQQAMQTFQPAKNPVLSFFDSQAGATVTKGIMDMFAGMVASYQEQQKMKNAVKQADEYMQRYEKLINLHNQALMARAQAGLAAGDVPPPPPPQSGGFPQFPNPSGQAGQVTQLGMAYGMPNPGMDPGMIQTQQFPPANPPQYGAPQIPSGMDPYGQQQMQANPFAALQPGDIGRSRPRAMMQQDQGYPGMGMPATPGFGMAQPVGPTPQQAMAAMQAEMEKLKKERDDAMDKAAITPPRPATFGVGQPPVVQPAPVQAPAPPQPAPEPADVGVESEGKDESLIVPPPETPLEMKGKKRRI